MTSGTVNAHDWPEDQPVATCLQRSFRAGLQRETNCGGLSGRDGDHDQLRRRLVRGRKTCAPVHGLRDLTLQLPW